MNFIAGKPVAPTSEDQVAEILRTLRPLLRQSEELARNEINHGVTPAMTRLLARLQIDGPQTVPALARALGTGRQFIQRMVNDLLACGLIERRDNPAHRKSWLCSLTSEGDAHVVRASRHERGILARLADAVTDSELQTCLGVLERFLHELDGAERSGETARERVQPSQTYPAPGRVETEVAQILNPPPSLPQPDSGQEKDAVAPHHVPPVTLNWNGGGGLRIA